MSSWEPERDLIHDSGVRVSDINTGVFYKPQIDKTSSLTEREEKSPQQKIAENRATLEALCLLSGLFIIDNVWKDPNDGFYKVAGKSGIGETKVISISPHGLKSKGILIHLCSACGLMRCKCYESTKGEGYMYKYQDLERWFWQNDMTAWDRLKKVQARNRFNQDVPKERLSDVLVGLFTWKDDVERGMHDTPGIEFWQNKFDEIKEFELTGKMRTTRFQQLHMIDTKEQKSLDAVNARKLAQEGVTELSYKKKMEGLIAKASKPHTQHEYIEARLKQLEALPLWREEDLVPATSADPEFYMSMVGKWDKPKKEHMQGGGGPRP